MSEKRFTLNLMKKPSEIEMDGKMISKYDVVRLLNEQQAEIDDLKEENEQLKKKIKPSIYNKKDGDYKWNVDNNTILNIKTGETFYLRNSGAVENLVGLLNKQQATISKLEEEKGYWKSKAMTLLMQVRRLTPRMSAKEVIEFGKELEDE